MNIRINGQEVGVEGGTLADVLRSLSVTDGDSGVAVAINEEVVPRGEWTTRALKPGDAIEIVRPVQGG